MIALGNRLEHGGAQGRGGPQYLLMPVLAIALMSMSINARLLTASLLAGLWGSLLLVGAAGGATELWQPLQVYTAKTVAGASASTAHDTFITLKDPASLDRELASAKAQGQWVMLDYYADWCVSCKVMEKQV